MLLFALGLMMLATDAAEISVKDEMVTALSIVVANIKPPPGTATNVTGTVKLMQSQTGGMTAMMVRLSGLPPNTPHGFHIHEFGDIVTDGCQSTGSHYNPFNHTHGGPQDQIRHVGDLGNVMSDGVGDIVVEIEDRLVSLVGKYSVIGRAFVVHQKRDDLGRGTGPARKESLKTGNAGPRLGCGIIFHAPLN